MIITATDLLLALKYDEAELPTLELFLRGGEAFLQNAGMYHADNALTATVLTLIVGFWMDNREANYTDYKKVSDFPLGMQALLNQLRYLPTAEEVQDYAAEG